MSRSSQAEQLSFGGWHSYQLWADHDFVPRTRHDVLAGETSQAPETAAETVATTQDGISRIDWPEELDQEAPAADQDLDDVLDVDMTMLVRPYTRTGGRTSAPHQVGLETLISVTDHGMAEAAQLPRDQGAICRLCCQPVSLAEIAALLRVPLGVARVLVSDLAEESLISVHGESVPDRPPMELMLRVLAGLHKL